MGSSLSINKRLSVERYRETARRLLHRRKTKAKPAETSLWQQELQPISAGQEPRSRADEHYDGEDRLEQSARDERAQEEVQYHYLRLLAALNRHQHRPTPPKCLTEYAEDGSTSDPEEASAVLDEEEVDIFAVINSTPPGVNATLPLRR